MASWAHDLTSLAFSDFGPGGPQRTDRLLTASARFDPDAPLDTRDGHAYGSLLLPPATAARAAADIRIAVFPALTPPVACATRHRSALSHSDNLIPPSPSARKPGARSLRTPIAANLHPTAGLRAPPVFCNDRLQHLFVQTQIHHRLFQLRVLVP